jgi:transcriptional regulator with XRE-family HTH domain
MAASHQKRGEKNRALDPLLARALERLGRHIEDKGITQPELSKLTGLTQGHISKLLGGKSPEASFYAITRLAIGAGVSVDWLIADAPAPAMPAAIPTPSVVPPSKKKTA